MVIESLIGTILGLAGTGVTTYSNYKMAELDIKSKEMQFSHDLNMLVQGAKADAIKAQGEEALEEARAFTKSQEYGNMPSQSLSSEWINKLFSQEGKLKYLTVPIGVILVVVLGIGDAIKDMMRSIITLYSMIIASWVTYKSWFVLEASGMSALNADTAATIWSEASSLVLMLMVTIVTWWFGDRRMAKHLMHLKGKELTT